MIQGSVPRWKAWKGVAEQWWREPSRSTRVTWSLLRSTSKL